MTTVHEWACKKCGTVIVKPTFTKLDTTEIPFKVLDNCPTCKEQVEIEPKL